MVDPLGEWHCSAAGTAFKTTHTPTIVMSVRALCGRCPTNHRFLVNQDCAAMVRRYPYKDSIQVEEQQLAAQR